MPIRHDFGNATGGLIRVPIGKYSAICINSDTEGVVCRNTDRRETFEVTTRTTDLLSDFYPRKKAGQRSPVRKAQRMSVWPWLPTGCGAAMPKI